MTENEKRLYNLAEESAKSRAEIQVSLARIETTLSCVPEMHDKLKAHDDRLDVLEKARGNTAIAAWQKIVALALVIVGAVLTTQITTDIASNYTSRDSTQPDGNVVLPLMLEVSDGDLLKMNLAATVDGGAATIDPAQTRIIIKRMDVTIV